jgi:hypothetical protein
MHLHNSAFSLLFLLSSFPGIDEAVKSSSMPGTVQGSCRCLDHAKLHFPLRGGEDTFSGDAGLEEILGLKTATLKESVRAGQRISPTIASIDDMKGDHVPELNDISTSDKSNVHDVASKLSALKAALEGKQSMLAPLLSETQCLQETAARAARIRHAANNRSEEVIEVLPYPMSHVPCPMSHVPVHMRHAGKRSHAASGISLHTANFSSTSPSTNTSSPTGHAGPFRKHCQKWKGS